MSLIIGFIMIAMERDRNIAMGLGPNTYTAATITTHIKRVSLSISFNLFHHYF